MDGLKSFYYEFGNYRLDTDNKLLLQGREVIPLPPKSFEILQLLVENSGQTVSKEIFFDELWANTFVEETNLAQYIFHLRKTLGANENKNKKGDKFIETIPKRGYRFVAPVRQISKESIKGNSRFIEENEESQPIGKTNFFTRLNWKINFGVVLIIVLTIGAFLLFNSQKNKVIPPTKNPSLAVLLFKQPNDDTTLYQTAGLTDSLISKFSVLKQIRVRPLAAILKTKKSDPLEMGRELQVETILTGTFEQTENHLKIKANLVNVADGAIIWQEDFDVSPPHIFEVQETISGKVSQLLVGQLSETEKFSIHQRTTQNFAAYQDYSLGRYFLQSGLPEDVEKAVELFRQALQKDSNYSMAYFGLSDAYLMLSSLNAGKTNSVDYQKIAKENAVKAIEKDNFLAEPHANLGAIIFDETKDWFAAEKEFLKAIELNPNHVTAYRFYSLLLLSKREFLRAEEQLKRALEIDPRSPNLNMSLGQLYYYSGNYQLATTQFEHTLEIDAHHVPSNIYLALSLTETGKTEQAISILEDIHQKYPKNSSVSSNLACIYAFSGKQVKAQWILNILEKLETPTSNEEFGIALINAHLGNTEKSFAILEKINSDKNLNFLARLKFDPKLEILRQDKRFEKLFKP